jgi:hypothetical protein
VDNAQGSEAGVGETGVLKRIEAASRMKSLTIGWKTDRVPRGYAATREGEPVRMGNQNWFMLSLIMIMLVSAGDKQSVVGIVWWGGVNRERGAHAG